MMIKQIPDQSVFLADPIMCKLLADPNVYKFPANPIDDVHTFKTLWFKQSLKQ
jgi:hypothetical protein